MKTSSICRSKTRRAFSLIEMIVATLAATVLMTALAASMVISIDLLESPPTEPESIQVRMIEDRLRNDLRFATRVNASRDGTFEIQRSHPTTGLAESIVYQSSVDGFTRQADAGPVVTLDEESPKETWGVDSSTISEELASTNAARVCATSRAETSGSADELEIDVPDTLKPGDHVFLCLSAKTPDLVSIDHAGWQTVQSRATSSLRLSVFHRSYDNSWPESLKVSATPASAMAVALIAVENVNTVAPIAWSNAGGGYAFSILWTTHPSYSESGTVTNSQLNLQIYAAEDDPWTRGLMGMSGFSDLVHTTAASGFSSENSIGVVVRNGPAPDLSFTPRLLHQDSGYWIRIAVQVEVAP
ncbi:MAG: hypothetical protein AAGI63_18490 [Planctomycetota bacterium]